MNITDAIREAIAEGGCITVPEYADVIKIKPTNTTANCILMNADGSNPSKHGWQPSANALLRDDWIVTI
ncbi:MAG: DUF2829 domain-containing protein [Clostridia bacterium]|nr:DUF2829 domain-containing protein [Clostridia bacterium]